MVSAALRRFRRCAPDRPCDGAGLDHAERRGRSRRRVRVVGFGLARLAADHLERALELRAVDRDQLLDLAQHVGQRLQVHLLAVAQLELELGEALGDLQRRP